MSQNSHLNSSTGCNNSDETGQQESIQQLKKQLPLVLENPVIQDFIKEEKRKKLMDNAFENPTSKNINLLNEEFKKFYRVNRVVRYSSVLIRNLSSHLDKLNKRRNERYNLIFDKPYDEEGNTVGMILQENKQEFIEPIEVVEAGIFPVKNERLDNAMRSLSDKQKRILYYYYIKEFSKREIAKILGESEANIGYWVKKTLAQLKNSL